MFRDVYKRQQKNIDKKEIEELVVGSLDMAVRDSIHPVSYTHLKMETESGIKTAIICLMLSTQQTGTSRKHWNTGGSSGRLPLIPVSYTHLDVYKRQAFQSIVIADSP